MIPVRVNPAAPQPKAKRAQPPLRLRMPSAVPPLQTLSAQRSGTHWLTERAAGLGSSQYGSGQDQSADAFLDDNRK